MDSAKPYLVNEQEDYKRIEEDVKAVVNKTFLDLTGREIEEGGLIGQLKGLESNPLDLRQIITDEIAERLKVTHLRKIPKTARELYDAFIQLINAGAKPEEDYFFSEM